MRKKLIIVYFIAITMIIGIAAFNVNIKGNHGTDVALSNVEAIARGEDPNSSDKYDLGCAKCINPQYGWQGIIFFCKEGPLPGCWQSMCEGGDCVEN